MPLPTIRGPGERRATSRGTCSVLYRVSVRMSRVLGRGARSPTAPGEAVDQRGADRYESHSAIQLTSRGVALRDPEPDLGVSERPQGPEPPANDEPSEAGAAVLGRDHHVEVDRELGGLLARDQGGDQLSVPFSNQRRGR